MNNKHTSLTYKKVLFFNFSTMLLFSIVFNIIAFFLIKNIYNLTLTRLLDIFGYSYLTSENMGTVIKSPISILFIIVSVILMLFFVVYEANVIIVTYRASYNQYKLSIFDMIYYTTLNIKRIYKRRSMPTYFLLAYITIISSFFPLYNLLQVFHISNSAIKTFIKNYKLGTWPYIIAGLLVLLGYLFIFAPLFTCFDKYSFLGGLKESIVFWNNNFFHFLMSFGLTNAIIILIYYALYIALNLISVNLVQYYANPEIALNLALIIGDNINIVLLIATGIIFPIIILGLAVHMYYKDHESLRCGIPLFIHRPLKRKRDYAFTVVFIIIFALLTTNVFYVIDTGIQVSSQIESRIYITSHRGDSNDAPENTLPAFQSAIDNLTDYIEFDVRETSDGVLVLMHDAKVTRTTNSEGRVSEMTYDELMQLDAGGWFSEEYLSTKIPTLEEVLTLCKDYDVKLNVEIKYDKLTPDIATHVVNMIELYDMTDRCIISSTSSKILVDVKELTKDIPTGKIISYDYVNNYDDTYIDFYSMRSSFITKSKVMKIHENGKEVHAWTVNSTSELTRCQRLGVDNVITDMPSMARELFRENEGPSTVEEYMTVLMDSEK